MMLDESIQRLLASCRKLEDFELPDYAFSNIKVVDISIPTLKRLTLEHIGGIYTLLLNFPVLEHFESVDTDL